MNSSVGLAATRIAAMAPVTRPDTRTPSAYASRTRAAPQSGFTMNGPQPPPILMNIAISSGNPGAYVGTMVWPAAGRYASGANVQSALGHGTEVAKSW